jgi:hypothetical protein
MARRLLPPLLLTAACTAGSPIPGPEGIGTFDFHATLLPAEEGGCPVLQGTDWRGAVVPYGDGGLVEVPGPDGGAVPLDFAATLDFSGTLSREPSTGQAYFTLREHDRLATFDGQVVEATDQAPRRFPQACGPECGDVVLEETVRVALLSTSQAEALGGACPTDALDGGVPAPDDAGIRGPGPTPDGYDAVRACGLLVEVVRPPEGCACAACTVHYRLEGAAR